MTTGNTQNASRPYLSKLLGAASLMALMTFAPAVVAQDAADDEDEVIATGIRQSLKDARDLKRDADKIVDAISAEDIGKSTDDNIAEALQRVTGVSINRVNGEGTTVSVRGVNANLNNVTLNGVTVTTAAGDVRNNDSGSAVDLSVFSSNLLSKIEVVKTPSADDDEGSLGAAIRLSTFKPLGARKDRRILDVQGRMNDLKGDSILGDGRIGLTMSGKFEDDKIGVSLIASHEENSGRVDTMRIPRFELANASNGFTNGAGVNLFTGGLTNGDTGALDENPRDANGNLIPEETLRVLLPFEVTYDQLYFQSVRDNVTTSIQFQPNDNTDVQFDATYSETKRDRDATGFNIRPVTQFFPLYQGADNVYDPASSTLTSFRNTANGFGPGNARNIGYARPNTLNEDTTEKSIVLGVNATHSWENFEFNLRGGTSRSTVRDDNFIFSTAQIENQAQGGPNSFDNGFNGFDNRPGLTQGYDCVIGGICSIFFSDTVDNRTQGGTNGANPELAIVDDPFEFDIGSISSRDRGIDDKSANLFFDVDWDTDIGPIYEVEAGLKWSKRNKRQRQTNSFVSRFGFPGLARQNIVPFATSTQGLRDGFGEALGLPRDNITDGIVGYDAQAMLDAARAVNSNVGITSPELRNFRDLSNETYGGYVKFNFDLLDERLRGDIGLRYVQTDVDVSGGATASLSAQQFTMRPENLEFFGYFGAGDPRNTSTLADATAAVEGVLGRDLVGVNDPRFVQPGGVLVEDTHSYDNFLPSMNLSYALSDDKLLRFAASKTMARPNIDRTRPNFSFNENLFDASFASGGNPQLNPFKSTNLDASFEWYYGDSNLFSFTLFGKSLEDSERTFAQAFYIRDARDILYDADGVAITDPALFGTAIGQPGFIPGPSSLLLPLDPTNQPLGECLPNRVLDLSLIEGRQECEVVQFNQPVNAANAYVRGFEVGIQHAFDNLDGFWGGFGVAANYTYADSEVEAQTITNALGDEFSFLAAPLPNTSLHTLNTTVYYDRDGKQIRLAYNTRSDFLRSSAPLVGGTRTYGEGNDSLDMSGGWQLTNSLRLNFQAVNLLDTVRRDYAVLEGDTNATLGNAIPGEPLGLGDAPTGRTTFLQNTGRIYRVGLRYEF